MAALRLRPSALALQSLSRLAWIQANRDEQARRFLLERILIAKAIPLWRDAL
jgi:hypothetical protein